MIKLVYVDSIPKDLEKGQYLIGPVSFLEEINQVLKNRSINMTELFYLHGILDVIFSKYNKTLKAVRAKIPLANYVGLKVENVEALDKIIIDILKKHAPSVLEEWLQDRILKRPWGTDTILFYDEKIIKHAFDVFIRNNIDEQRSTENKKSKNSK
jgi:hypothetical protein